jgi:hypothetical protein
LREIGRMAEGDRVGREEGCKWRDQIRGCGDFPGGYVSKNENQGGRW